MRKQPLQWQKLGWLDARRLRSRLAQPLPAVPHCVSGPPPRDLTLVTRDGQAIDDPMLRNGFAVRGLVERASSRPGQEGPDFDITIVFMAGRTPARVRWQGGWDATHWAISSPEHHAWFHDRMLVEGAAVTLLIDGTGVQILGMLEAFEPVDLLTALDRAQASAEPTRTEWLQVGVDLLAQACAADRQDFAARVGPIATAWSDSPDPAAWPRELARRLRVGEPVISHLAAVVPTLPGARRRVWVAE